MAEKKRNKLILTLSEWAVQPEFMTRFAAVTLYSQRVSFVKQVLCLEERDDVVAMAMRSVCERHGVPYQPKKGAPLREIHHKSLSVEQRFHVSMLLNMQRSTGDSGLACDPAEGGVMTANLMLDRMIVAYDRYLGQQKATPSTALVSFEWFWFIFQKLQLREVDMSDCASCGGSYINLRVNATMSCPVCATLRLAKPKMPLAASIHNHSMKEDVRQVAMA